MKTLRERFEAKVDRDGPLHPVLGTVCHLWTGTSNRQGYGRVGAGSRGKHQLAHRAAWRLANGEIPDGMCVLHRCDNPPCVNVVDHLFLGTKKDNSRDMAAKGRGVFQQHPEKAARGNRNGSRRYPERLQRGAVHSAVMRRVASRGDAHSAIMRRVAARGDRHSSRTHTERLARGDRNGRHTQPERTARGERVSNAKLTEREVKIIRVCADLGATQQRLGAYFGVDHSAIGCILRGRTWRHVVQPPAIVMRTQEA